MRVSNNIIAKGSIIYADFDESSFLNKRPLIVVSDPIPVFSQVVVCETGTMMKPGIQVKLWNYFERKAIGGVNTSTIYPYSLFTIPTSKIRSCIGTLDRFVMKELDNAVKFFLGYSDEIPEFMKSMEEKLFGTSYSYINPPFTSHCQKISSLQEGPLWYHGEFTNPTDIISEDDELSEERVSEVVFEGFAENDTEKEEINPIENMTPIKFQEIIKEDKKEKISDKKKKSRKDPKKSRNEVKVESDNFSKVRDFMSKYCVFEENAVVEVSDLALKYKKLVDKGFYPPIKGNVFGIYVKSQVLNNFPQVKYERLNDKAILTGCRLMYKNSSTIKDRYVHTDLPTPKVNIPIPLPSATVIKDILGDNDTARIISRNLSAEDISKMYAISIEDATETQKRLTDFVLSIAKTSLPKVSSNPQRLLTFDDSVKVGYVLLLHFGAGSTFNKIKLDAKADIRFSPYLDKIINRFNINFADSKWNEFTM